MGQEKINKEQRTRLKEMLTGMVGGELTELGFLALEEIERLRGAYGQSRLDVIRVFNEAMGETLRRLRGAYGQSRLDVIRVFNEAMGETLRGNAPSEPLVIKSARQREGE